MAKKGLIGSTVSGSVLAFTVGDAGGFDIDTAKLSADIVERAMFHGLRQKVSDAAAISKDELTGDPAKDAATKLAAMKAVAARLMDGDWSQRNEEGAGPVAGIIYRAFEEWALARAAKAKANLAPEAVRALYDAKTRSEQLALRNVPEIATIIDRMKAERGAAAPVDTKALLAELGL